MIRFESVTFFYQKGEPVFEGLDLEIGSGLTLVLGVNGSGKSTLLKLAAGVESPDAGAVIVGGRDLWKDEIAARRGLAYLPEFPDLSPYATIGEICDFVCRLRGEPVVRGREALDVFGLGPYAHRSVRELSLGQKRRATFAAAWIGNPTHVLLDEPLGALDRKVREAALDWIFHLAARGAAVLIVSHEIDPFLDRAVRAVGLAGGRPTVVSPLPERREDRAAVLEGLARGG
jgi:ABC-type multidrug transport system ATPase subunit